MLRLTHHTECFDTYLSLNFTDPCTWPKLQQEFDHGTSNTGHLIDKLTHILHTSHSTMHGHLQTASNFLPSPRHSSHQSPLPYSLYFHTAIFPLACKITWLKKADGVITQCINYSPISPPPPPSSLSSESTPGRHAHKIPGTTSKLAHWW